VYHALRLLLSKCSLPVFGDGPLRVSFLPCSVAFFAVLSYGLDVRGWALCIRSTYGLVLVSFIFLTYSRSAFSSTFDFLSRLSSFLLSLECTPPFCLLVLGFFSGRLNAPWLKFGLYFLYYLRVAAADGPLLFVSWFCCLRVFHFQSRAHVLLLVRYCWLWSLCSRSSGGSRYVCYRVVFRCVCPVCVGFIYVLLVRGAVMLWGRLPSGCDDLGAYWYSLFATWSAAILDVLYCGLIALFMYALNTNI